MSTFNQPDHQSGLSLDRVHVWVSGQVQGVGYRYATQQQASGLGLTGWVRNLPDGRVEAVFEGPPDLVAQMVAWCEQGPDTAQVDRVLSQHEPPEGLDAFQVLRG